eukprot:355645-Chlamydomonas_euryale.AAC.25
MRSGADALEASAHLQWQRRLNDRAHVQRFHVHHDMLEQKRQVHGWPASSGSRLHKMPPAKCRWQQHDRQVQEPPVGQVFCVDVQPMRLPAEEVGCINGPSRCAIHAIKGGLQSERSQAHQHGARHNATHAAALRHAGSTLASEHHALP